MKYNFKENSNYIKIENFKKWFQKHKKYDFRRFCQPKYFIRFCDHVMYYVVIGR